MWGRPGDESLQKLSKLNAKDMLPELRRQGFQGLWVNRDAYPSEMVSFESEISNTLGKATVVSDDGKMAFYKVP
jgi:hypothetical protein